ncbi:MAG: hypothetical protein JWN70_3320 [Planctomycetaceae bacterium]|nr:hypothetical protein [Planctomycetaceae bacterium]
MKPILFCASLTVFVWGFSALIAEQATSKPAATPKKAAPAKPVEAKPKAPVAESKPAGEAVVFPAAEAIVGERSPEDVAAIKTLAKSFAQGFNQHQPQAIAELFTADAEITDEGGRTLQGRPAIVKVFDDLFKLHPESRVQVQVNSVRFLGKVLATEEGTTTTTWTDGKQELPIETSRYSVTYVKQDGTWKMANARDLPNPPPTPTEHLHGLDWLVGTWVDENSDSLVQTTFRWSDDQNYLLSDFTMQVRSNPPLNGTQRIGWDPRTNELRAWTFYSDGGFGEALWTRDGNRWISKTMGVSRQGKIASATNILTQTGKDHATFQSRDRIAGGVPVPDIVEIPIVRKPPPPSAP